MSEPGPATSTPTTTTTTTGVLDPGGTTSFDPDTARLASAGSGGIGVVSVAEDTTATAPSPPGETYRPMSARLRALGRGRPDDPAWVRPALIGLLAGTAGLYLWRLGESGWANDYYSAAVQAASQSWKAFFFGSSDAQNFITVDKSPAFLWPMALAARLFGVNSWSILVPQALEGVAAVGVLYLAVRRWSGPAAGLVAGAVLALTPAATLMFRFNNPDALLTLLMTCGAYAVVRAVEAGSTRWIVAAGSLVGWAFLAKMLQALLVVPAFGLVYLVAAPVALSSRIRRLLLAGLAMVVSAGWWVAAVELWPAGSRPYVGGSQTNSVVELIFGYNGFGRLTGDETGSVGGSAAGGGRWGATGLDRLFNTEFGGQISWLLPAALVLLVTLLALAGQEPRTDRTRAAALLWGGWLLVTGLAISLGQGIIHPYYTVALAPAIGALVGIGVVTLWRRRHQVAEGLTLAGVVALTAWWASVLLDRTPGWYPAVRVLVLIGGLVAAGALALGAVAAVGDGAQRWRHPAVTGLVALGVVLTGLLGPTAYAFATVDTPHSGALPSAGPASSGPGGLVRSVGGGTRGGGFGSPPALGPILGNGGPSSPGNQSGPGGAGRADSNGLPGPSGGQNRRIGPRDGSTGVLGNLGARFGGGILDATDPSEKLTAVLGEDADRYRWVAATVSANQAAGYQLATGEPVMAIGGFNGTDPTPTLDQFQQYVADGDVHWFIAGGRGGLRGGGETSGRITDWVEDNFRSVTVDGVTLYDLSSPLS